MGDFAIIDKTTGALVKDIKALDGVLLVNPGIVLPDEPWSVPASGANTDAVKAAAATKYHVVTGIVISNRDTACTFDVQVNGVSKCKMSMEGYAGVGAGSALAEVKTVPITFPTQIVAALNQEVKIDVTGGGADTFVNLFGYSVTP